MLADLLGKPLGGVVSFPTVRDPKARDARSPRASRRCSPSIREVDACEGIGVVVPGMVEHSTMRVLHAPTLGWRNVDLREPLAAATGLAGADRELRPRLRARADLGAARRRRGPAAISCSSASRTASASA